MLYDHACQSYKILHSPTSRSQFQSIGDRAMKVSHNHPMLYSQDLVGIFTWRKAYFYNS